MEYGGFLKLADVDATASGVVFLDAELESSAPDWSLVPARLNGHLDLLLFPDDIEAEFLDLWAKNLVLALLPIGKDKKKKLNCLAGRFEINKGVLKSKKILLDSTDVIVRGRGSIDIDAQELDLSFAPQAKLEKFGRFFKRVNHINHT